MAFLMPVLRFVSACICLGGFFRDSAMPHFDEMPHYDEMPLPNEMPLQQVAQQTGCPFYREIQRYSILQ